jgi:LysM repeat protein
MALALTGCFRSAGEDLPPTAKGDVVLVSNTTPVVQQTQPPLPTSQPTQEPGPTEETVTAFPTPQPTLSPFPTLSPATNTPFPTFSSAMNTPFPTFGPSSTWTPQVVVIAPTFTSQPTFTPPPTYTPLPTYTPPPTYTPQATTAPQATPVPVNTRGPQPVFQPGAGPTATFTSVPFQLLPPTATYTPYPPAAPVEANPLGEGGSPVVATPIPGGPVVATPVSGGPVVATPVVVAQVATLTPTPPFAPTFTPALSEFSMTATQLVYGATVTQAYLWGTVIPPTPFGGQTIVQPQPVVPGQYPPNATVITATPGGVSGMCAQHRVAIGETLSRIALRYGVTTQAIATANNITNPDLIQAGNTLQIPCPAAPAVTPVPVQQGTGQTTTTTTGTVGTQIYTVQAGDNIYQISLKFNVDMGELVAINGLNEVTMNTISIGQQLIIPVPVITPTPIPGAAPVVGPTLTPYIIIITPIPGTTG